MATFTSAACSLASSASPTMAGAALLPATRLPCGSTSSARPSLRSARASAVKPTVTVKATEEEQVKNRRALIFGAALLALSGTTALISDSALAIDGKKKKNKCPTICVQTPTASCCFGYGK